MYNNVISVNLSSTFSKQSCWLYRIQSVFILSICPFVSVSELVKFCCALTSVQSHSAMFQLYETVVQFQIETCCGAPTP